MQGHEYVCRRFNDYVKAHQNITVALVLHCYKGPFVAGFPPCWSHQQYVIRMRRTADYRLYSDLYGTDMGRQSSPTKELSTLRRFGSRRRSTGTREPSLSVSGNSAGNHRLSPGCLLVVIIPYYLLEQYFMIM